jgi:carbonic anhydrase
MTLARREFLRMATLGCACCLATGRTGAEPTGHSGAAASHPHWSYAGNTGPEHWGELQPDFRVCQLGLEQTPIDLNASVRGEAGQAALDYRQHPLRIVNNGHTIQVNVDPGSTCTIGNIRYDLAQFHFHHPSEHLLAGRPFDMECHFVHRSSAGGLAVVGVFIKAGTRNEALAPVFDALPRTQGPEVRSPATINLAAMLPRAGGYFRYMGSLTTPPCSEGLTWTVFKEPTEASPDQIRQFAALFPNNARPVQRTNRRFVIETN